MTGLLVGLPGLSRLSAPRLRRAELRCILLRPPNQSNANPSSQLGSPSTQPSQSPPSTALASRCHTPAPSIIHLCAGRSRVANARSTSIPHLIFGNSPRDRSARIRLPGRRLDAVQGRGSAKEWPPPCWGCLPSGALIRETLCFDPLLPISALAAFNLLDLPHFPKPNTSAIKN
jgi:hypothetical protein